MKFVGAEWGPGAAAAGPVAFLLLNPLEVMDKRVGVLIGQAARGRKSEKFIENAGTSNRMVHGALGAAFQRFQRDLRESFSGP